MINSNLNKRDKGFTLVEMAIVLVILGFVLAALLLPLQAQREQVFQTQTQTTLENVKRALLGFAQAQGRLPCPATAASNGMEQPLGGGSCTQQMGFLPAATLGVTPTDANGFAIDGWNNPIRYAVTQANAGGAGTPDFTTAGDMATVGMAALTPNIRVCATSAVAGCTAAINLTNNAAVVIYSTGATGALGAGGADETENLNAVANVDTVLVSHDPTSAVGSEFDHTVVWLSPYVLYNAMIQAGQLH
jgi:prepilin-type N-terminal cleavage/methylation domain-containing protein